MKQIILIRHAKSDWPENTEDFDRPLSERGIQDAEKMAKHMFHNQLKIDKIITSPAKRTIETSKFFTETFQVDADQNEKLYHPSENNFLSIIYELDNALTSVVFCSHNNGISNFANTLTGDIFHFPTCGVAGYHVHCDHWSEFEGAKKELVFFYDPKKL